MARRDQPRWPRGTPVAPGGHGPGGGRFRDGGVGWATAVAGRLAPRRRHPGLGLTREQLQGLFDNPPRSEHVGQPITLPTMAAMAAMTDTGSERIRIPPDHQVYIGGWIQIESVGRTGGGDVWSIRLAGGQTTLRGGMEELTFRYAPRQFQEGRLSGGNAAQTSIRVYDDGRRIIVKRSNEQDAHREYLASLVGEAIGAPVPDVILTGEPDTIWMGHAEGGPGFDTGLDVAAAAGQDPYEITDQWEEAWADSEPAWRLALLDLLTQNGDRHHGNWLVDPPDDTMDIDPASVVGIDHNRSWAVVPRPPDEADRPPLWIQDIVATRTALLDPDDHDQWRTGMMAEAEALEIDERLRALEPEFAKLGRMDWYDSMIGVWEQYLYGAVRGQRVDWEEGARVASPAQIAQHVRIGNPIYVRFSVEDTEEWSGWGGSPPPGWHLVSAVSPVDSALTVVTRGGRLYTWSPEPGAALTYRVGQP